MDNSFDEQMERYKKQMLHYYKIGKQRSPEPEAVPAAVYPSGVPETVTPEPAGDPPAPQAPVLSPEPEMFSQDLSPGTESVPQMPALEPEEDLRELEEITESDPALTPEPERPRTEGITFEEAGNGELAQYLKENPKIGFIKLQVSTARSAIPISGAKVTISRMIGSSPHVFATAVTDMDGLVAPIPLPAPDRSLSEQPENQGEPVPFATYDIRTEYPRHVPVENISVPVFDGIVSIQPVSLIPDTNGNPAPEEIYEQEPEL